MAKLIRLTDSKIKSLAPPKSGRKEVLDAVVPGLRVRLGRSGTKSFVLRKRIGSNAKEVHGRLNDMVSYISYLSLATGSSTLSPVRK